MSVHFPKLPTLTEHLLRRRTYSTLRSIINTTKSVKMKKTIPEKTTITLSELYRDRISYHTADRLELSEVPTYYKPDRALNDKIAIYLGDITTLKVDAIVNAANKSLLGGGGVDGRIHDVAGGELVKECRTLNGCETGSAKITDAYKLPCRKVIHAVGPVFYVQGKDESKALLHKCYNTSLIIAAEHDLKTIAFSCLSTGVYGYPSQKAASVALNAVRSFLESTYGQKVDQVLFCLFLRKDVDAYLDWIPMFFPPPPEDLEAAKAVGTSPKHAKSVHANDSSSATVPTPGTTNVEATGTAVPDTPTSAKSTKVEDTSSETLSEEHQNDKVSSAESINGATLRDTELATNEVPDTNAPSAAAEHVGSQPIAPGFLASEDSGTEESEKPAVEVPKDLEASGRSHSEPKTKS